MKLYHVRCTFDYLAYTHDEQDAEMELHEAIFDAEPADMTTVTVTECKPGDSLPFGWESDSQVYGNTTMTVADCLAKLEFDRKQTSLQFDTQEASA